MDINSEHLIALVEERVILWDKTLYDYKNKVLRTAAWREICSILRPDFDGLQEIEKNEYAKMVSVRWANIRDTWQKAIRKKRSKESTGNTSKRCRDYVYLEQLMFLKKNQQPKPNQDFSRKRDRSEMEQNIEWDPNENNEFPSSKDRKINYKEIDEKVAMFLETRMNMEMENHHLSFFKGILPALNTLTIDETLEFQSSVLALVQKIKEKPNYMQRFQQDSSYMQHPEWDERYRSMHYSENSGLQDSASFLPMPGASNSQVPSSPATSSSNQSAKSPDPPYADYEELDNKDSIKLLDE